MGVTHAMTIIRCPGTASGGDELEAIALAARDPAAFGRLYREHYPRVAGYLYRRVGNQDVAEDLAGETFLAARKAIGRYRPTGAPIGAWFLRIATNKANERDRRSRRRGVATARVTHGPGDNAEARERVETLYRALRTLNADQQSVLALVYFESMSVARAATVLGVREGTVKSRLARARDALRVEVERLGGKP